MSAQEQGTAHFKAGEFKKALSCYKHALDSEATSDADKAHLHKNMAACFLKMKQYDETVLEATLCEFFTFVTETDSCSICHCVLM